MWPRGGETIIVGTVAFVEWLAAVPAGQEGATVSIEFSTQGPAGPWQPIGPGELPNNGCWQSVPDDVPTSDDCHLRLTLNTTPPVTTITPQPFTKINTGSIPGDVNGDGVVDVLDLLAVIAAWGNPGGPEDVNGDGIVDVLDLLLVLANWS